MAAKLHRHPARRRVLPGMDRAAFLAFARICIGVERLIERRQVLHQMLDLHLDAVHEVAALEAVPVEGVERVRTRRFHHEADRARLWPLRRMRRMWRQQEYVALAD